MLAVLKFMMDEMTSKKGSLYRNREIPKKLSFRM